MKKVLVTFGDSRIHRSLDRIRSQAEAMDLYDEILIFDETKLNDKFRNEFSEVLNTKTRGFGFWVWKPEVILQTLSTLSEGDIVHYIDAGCHLNLKGRKRLLQYFEMVEKSPSGILGFQAKRPEFPLVDDGRPIPKWIDKDWSKGDLIDYFGLRTNREILESPTIQSGSFFIRKSINTVEFVTNWLETYRANFHLADDTPSVSPNFESFKEHRHDQAIFSLMAKMVNASLISASEFWYPSLLDSDKGDWEYLQDFPIHAKRDLNFGFWKNLERKSLRWVKISIVKIQNRIRPTNIHEVI